MARTWPYLTTLQVDSEKDHDTKLVHLTVRGPSGNFLSLGR